MTGAPHIEILPTASIASTLRGQATESAGLKGGSMARRRYQTGHVFIRGVRERVWVGRWREDEVQTDGSIRRIEKSQVLGPERELKTKRLAQRRLDLILARINASEYRPGRAAILEEFSERWKTEVLAHRKPSTVRSATSHLRFHIVPQLGRKRLDEIGREAQQAFITRLAGNISRKTLINVLGTLSAMLTTAKSWGYICEPVKFANLTLPAGQVQQSARFFNGDEARRIIGTAPEPYRTMFAIAAMTGLRVGELLALQIDALDFERRIIHVRQSVWCGRMQTVKSKASCADIAMPEVLASLLRQYLKTWRPNPAKLLFLNRAGRPYNANKVVQKGLWPVLDELKIKRCGLHAFRHTHTSLLLEVGAPPTVAQAQLRHSDPRITLAIYGHVIGDSQRSAVEKVAEILRPDAPKLESAGEWIQ
jgi:integrase